MLPPSPPTKKNIGIHILIILLNVSEEDLKLNYSDQPWKFGKTNFAFSTRIII